MKLLKTTCFKQLPGIRPLFILCQLLIISCLEASAQESVEGKVVNEKGQPLPYVTVSLRPVTDTVSRTSTQTDTAGRFRLTWSDTSRYMLRMTLVGYNRWESAPFQAHSAGVNDIGVLTLQTNDKKLSSVTVTAMIPTITQLADKMVVTVEGTAMAAGNNAFTVLSKTPGVFIDAEGNVQLNGRSGVTVMIDGKLTYLSARDLRTLLESTPAENLKNIEVIANPSSKYDAEGSSGILNINLKKNTRQGINGSVYAGYLTNLKQHAYSSGITVNHKLGNWNSFVIADLSERVGGREATFTRIFRSGGNAIYFDQTATSSYKVPDNRSIRFGTDYSISKAHSVGFMVNLSGSTFNESFITDTYLGKAPKTNYQQIRAENQSHGRYSNQTFNLHYNGQLDTLGTTLSGDLFYVKIANRGTADFLNYFTDLNTANQVQDFLYTETPGGYTIQSGKADLSLPLPKSNKLEAGLKASRVISDNDFRFYFNNTGLVLDPQRTNHFRYDETIYAAYSNWSGNLGKKVSIQTGLRVEQTHSTGNQITTGQVNKRLYTGFFPSLFIQQKVSANYGINYTYSRRLTRPNYGSLNPFRSYRDPYTWTEGNPDLRPQYAHIFTLSQTFYKSYILQLNYQLSKDVITEVPKPEAATGITVYTTGNVNNGKSFVALGIVPVRLAKFWETQNYVQESFNSYTTISDGAAVLNRQWTFLFQSVHTIQLPKSFRLEMTALYRGPAASGLYHSEAYTRFDMAVKKSLFKKKVDLSLNGSDLFKTQRLKWAANYNGNVNAFDQYLRFRIFNFTLRYNFSKGLKLNSNRKTSTLDELNRAGG
ncbi:MAG TPA: outer membrane beta-barrel protein [Flavisolibacter sp.]|nr:outer membrane beta-barrel protein [Flavisolibacter sp.]